MSAAQVGGRPRHFGGDGPGGGAAGGGGLQRSDPRGGDHRTVEGRAGPAEAHARGGGAWNEPTRRRHVFAAPFIRNEYNMNIVTRFITLIKE
eukprot:1195607-Prorocentrum_minimum.AAC.3